MPLRFDEDGSILSSAATLDEAFDFTIHKVTGFLRLLATVSEYDEESCFVLGSRRAIQQAWTDYTTTFQMCIAICTRERVDWKATENPGVQVGTVRVGRGITTVSADLLAILSKGTFSIVRQQIDSGQIPLARVRELIRATKALADYAGMKNLSEFIDETSWDRPTKTRSLVNDGETDKSSRNRKSDPLTEFIKRDEAALEAICRHQKKKNQNSQGDAAWSLWRENNAVLRAACLKDNPIEDDIRKLPRTLRDRLRKNRKKAKDCLKPNSANEQRATKGDQSRSPKK